MCKLENLIGDSQPQLMRCLCVHKTNIYIYVWISAHISLTSHGRESKWKCADAMLVYICLYKCILVDAQCLARVNLRIKQSHSALVQKDTKPPSLRIVYIQMYRKRNKGPALV